MKFSRAENKLPAEVLSLGRSATGNFPTMVESER